MCPDHSKLSSTRMSTAMYPHSRPTRTRREFVRDAFCGFGGLALASILHEEQARAATVSGPLGPKAPHLPAKAKSVIFLYMAGGPSHLETFDPKPLLNKLEGQPRPKEFGEAKYQFVQRNAHLLGTRRTFKKYGQSGIEVSDLFPQTARCVDDLAVIRSCHGDMVVHSAAQYELFTGRVTPGFPEHGLVGPLRPGLREPVAAGLRGDARPERRARGRPADVRATASCRRSTNRRCSAAAIGRSSTSTCPRALHTTGGRAP